MAEEKSGVEAALDELLKGKKTEEIVGPNGLLKPRQVEPEIEAEPTVTAHVVAGRKTDKWAEARLRMEQAKNEPLPAPKPKLFDYPESDSIEPLVMLPKQPKEI